MGEDASGLATDWTWAGESVGRAAGSTEEPGTEHEAVKRGKKHLGSGIR